MAIRIDAQELRNLLQLTPSEQNIMLIGKHGIGKSEIITQFYMDLKTAAFSLALVTDNWKEVPKAMKREKTKR